MFFVCVMILFNILWHSRTSAEQDKCKMKLHIERVVNYSQSKCTIRCLLLLRDFRFFHLLRAFLLFMLKYSSRIVNSMPFTYWSFAGIFFLPFLHQNQLSIIFSHFRSREFQFLFPSICHWNFIFFFLISLSGLNEMKEKLVINYDVEGFSFIRAFKHRMTLRNIEVERREL